MSQKRIHKTLAEVEVENAIDQMGDVAAEYDEVEDFETEGESGLWDDAGAEESYDDLTAAAEELLTPDEEPDIESTKSHLSSVKSRKKISVAVPALILAAGLLMTVAGFTLSLMAMLDESAGGAMMANLRNSGLTPGLIVSVGLVMLTLVAVVRRHHEAVQLQLQQCLDDNHTNTEYLEYLVEAQRQTLSRRPASGEELEQVLLSLARQDDKINNLTKALKMYGKPLVDVNRLATENGQKAKAIAAQIGNLREKIEKMNEGMLDPMAEMLTRVTREGTDELNSKIDTIDQKLLEPIAELLSQNSRGNNDDLMRMLEILSEQLSGDVSKAMASVSKDSGADEVVTALREDFTEIRDTLSQIQLDASAAKAAASSAAAFAPAPNTAPSTAPQPTSPSQAPAIPAADNPAPPSPASTMSGVAKSPGKSVLGAIAKLKKMR